METQQPTRSGKDSYILAVIVAVALIIFFYTSNFLNDYLRMFFIWDIILCLVVGIIGRDRKIGFGGAFFASLLLSPLIGFIFVFNSSKNKDEAYKEKMLEIAENQAVSTSVADQLHKLNELRKEGVLTDEEFTSQKIKLLGE